MPAGRRKQRLDCRAVQHAAQAAQHQEARGQARKRNHTTKEARPQCHVHHRSHYQYNVANTTRPYPDLRG